MNCLGRGWTWPGKEVIGAWQDGASYLMPVYGCGCPPYPLQVPPSFWEQVRLCSVNDFVSATSEKNCLWCVFLPSVKYYLVSQIWKKLDSYFTRTGVKHSFPFLEWATVQWYIALLKAHLARHVCGYSLEENLWSYQGMAMTRDQRTDSSELPPVSNLSVMMSVAPTWELQ